MKKVFAVFIRVEYRSYSGFFKKKEHYSVSYLKGPCFDSMLDCIEYFISNPYFYKNMHIQEIYVPDEMLVKTLDNMTE